MFIGLYCCLFVMMQSLSLAWADLHHTDSLWALFQGPIVEFQLGYPIFYLGTNFFFPQQYFVQEETILHVLRDCPTARNFWLSMGVPQALNDFLSLDLMDWLKHNYLCSNSIHTNGLPWST